MAYTQQQVTGSNRVEWIETLGYDEKPFEQSLIDLGLDEQLKESDLTAYRQKARVFTIPIGPKGEHDHGPETYRRDQRLISNRKRGFISDIKDLIARREYQVEDSIVRDVKTRLFWLTCPNVKRSKVHYKEEITDVLASGVTMTVFGTGMGSNQTVSISYASEFEATNGAYKTIFVHFPLQISLVKVYEKGRLVGKGLRSEVPGERQTEFKLGIESETTEDGDIACRSADIFEEPFPLAGDTTESVHAYSRVEEARTEITVKSGIKAFDIEMTSKIKVSRKNKIILSFNLPAGHDYLLKRDRNGGGIWWA